MCSRYLPCLATKKLYDAPSCLAGRELKESAALIAGAAGAQAGKSLTRNLPPTAGWQC